MPQRAHTPGFWKFTSSLSTTTRLFEKGNNLIRNRLHNWPTCSDIFSFWTLLITLNLCRRWTGNSVTGRATHIEMMKEIISDLTTIDFILPRLCVEPTIRWSSVVEGIGDTEDFIAVSALNKVFLSACEWIFITLFLLGKVHRGEKPSPSKATDNRAQMTNFRGIVCRDKVWDEDSQSR